MRPSTIEANQISLFLIAALDLYTAMEKNPVFEFPDQPSLTEVSGGRDYTAPGNARPKHTPGRRISGRMCAVATAALFATLVVLALVGVIAIIVFRPTITESKTETVVSSDQVELLEQEMKNLRELVSEQATKHASNISSLKEAHSNAIQEILTTDIKWLKSNR